MLVTLEVVGPAVVLAVLVGTNVVDVVLVVVVLGLKDVVVLDDGVVLAVVLAVVDLAVVLTVLLPEGLTVVFEVTGLVVVVLDVLVVVGLTVVFDVVGLTDVVVVLTVVVVVVVEAVGFLVFWASCFVHHKITVRHIILNYRLKLGATKRISTKTRNSQTTYRGGSQEDDNKKKGDRERFHFLSRRCEGL